MAVDVEVDRFDFFVIFLCWDVHSKVRVEVISCRHTVLILFAQWNGVKDSVKDFSVAGEVTSGIDHRHTDPMSICLESQSAFQCLILYPAVDRYGSSLFSPSHVQNFTLVQHVLGLPISKFVIVF